jgi:hypothetical protein
MINFSNKVIRLYGNWHECLKTLYLYQNLSKTNCKHTRYSIEKKFTGNVQNAGMKGQLLDGRGRSGTIREETFS